MGSKRKPSAGRVRKLARQHKNLIHGVLLAAIAASLMLEGGKLADWLFVALGVVVETA